MKKVTKIKKNKPVSKYFELGATSINYTINGVSHNVWLVVSKNKLHGGTCYFLVKSNHYSAIDVAIWPFKGYDLHWKIEEYHMYIKQVYGLEDIQMKTFAGVQ